MFDILLAQKIDKIVFDLDIGETLLLFIFHLSFLNIKKDIPHGPDLS